MIDIAQAIDKPMQDVPTREERIREAAHRRYLARGSAAGDACADWYEAQAEIDTQDSIDPEDVFGESELSDEPPEMPDTAEQWTASIRMAGKTTFILAGWTGMNVVV